jgi:hypothetical protein
MTAFFMRDSNISIPMYCLVIYFHKNLEILFDKMNTSLNTLKLNSAAKLYYIPLALIAVFFSLSFTPRVLANETLTATFIIISIGLLASYTFMLLRIKSRKTPTEIILIISKPHYIQMLMHLCIFIYWGWYWPQVYEQTVLIFAQLVFVFIVDLIFRWYRGESWVIGFGRFPIIFSTNLFLWFRDDWFYYQFIMIAFGIFAKDYFTWIRDGRRTHIFNPSAISLSVASLLLIVTDSTYIGWGHEISNTLNHPPYIYIEIFILGLIVQYLFQVTLVTLATVISLLVLGVIYYQTTGVFFFYTSDIPIAVFLGLHLLVTDPSTSPKTTVGKFIFGFLYGVSVMMLFEILEFFGQPTFYDKLLCVPLLNLSVIYLDKIGRGFPVIFSGLKVSSYRLNFVFMSIWLSIFIIWYSNGFVGKSHPGTQSQFWAQACEKDLRKACTVQLDLTLAECEKGGAYACAKLGDIYKFAKGVPKNDVKAYEYVSMACDMGLRKACEVRHQYKSAN